MKGMMVIGIIFLFIGVAVQPGTATITPEEDINVEPKEFLFHTLIDITNSPDLKEILEQSNNKLIDSIINLKDIFQKILPKCPRVFFSILFTKPNISSQYLDFLYDNGCEIVKKMGEEDTLNIVESVKFRSPEAFDKINDIIDKNSELNAKIFTLFEMNKNLKSETFFPGHPIICTILKIIFIPLIIAGEFFFELFRHSNNLFPLLEEFFLLFCEVSFSSFMYFMILFGCVEWPPIM